MKQFLSNLFDDLDGDAHLSSMNEAFLMEGGDGAWGEVLEATESVGTREAGAIYSSCNISGNLVPDTNNTASNGNSLHFHHQQSVSQSSPKAVTRSSTIASSPKPASPNIRRRSVDLHTAYIRNDVTLIMWRETGTVIGPLLYSSAEDKVNYVRSFVEIHYKQMVGDHSLSVCSREGAPLALHEEDYTMIRDVLVVSETG
jgi:hypothetical protein